MQAYLLDTSALAPLIDDAHPKHATTVSLISSLGDAPVYASVIAISEMKFGILLHEKFKGKKLSNAEEMIKQLDLFPKFDVNHHVAAEYADLKSNLAHHYLHKMSKPFRSKYVEEWVDKFTGKALGVDDNDLWICAQGRCYNLTIIADDKMNRIKDADPLVDILPVKP